MTNLKDLDPDTRAYALVGQFLQAWSVMEASLHKCIQTSFKLSDTVAQIICTNLAWRNKIYVVTTIIDISAMPLNEDKENWKKQVNTIGNHAFNRNMIAHDPFLPDEAGTGVEFLTVKAKGKFARPNVVWSETKFGEEIAVVDGFRHTLNKLDEILKKSPIQDELYREAMAKALLDWQPETNWQPTRPSGPPGWLGSLFQLPPTLPDSPSATQEKSAQVPSSPPEKKKE